MATLVNYFDCDQARKGTGSISCEVPTGVPTGFFLAEKGWELTVATETFDTAYINTQIKAGTLIPFMDAINFTDNSEDPITFTTQIGVKLLARDGKPEFIFDFSKGYAFHSAAWSYNSFGAYDVILTYDNGVVFLAKNEDGTKLKGHSAGLVNTANFMHKDGAESEKTAVGFQLTNPNEYNASGVLLDPVSNGFDIDVVKGVIDVDIAHVSNATVEVVISVLASANNAIPILGLDAATPDFRATGTVIAISSSTYDSALKQYTLTFAADVSADYATGIVIILSDGTDDVVTVSGAHYKGTSPSSA